MCVCVHTSPSRHEEAPCQRLLIYDDVAVRHILTRSDAGEGLCTWPQGGSTAASARHSSSAARFFVRSAVCSVGCMRWPMDDATHSDIFDCVVSRMFPARFTADTYRLLPAGACRFCRAGWKRAVQTSPTKDAMEQKVYRCSPVCLRDHVKRVCVRPKKI